MKNIKIDSRIYFWGLVVILFLVYAYQKILLFPAHSIHSWRQGDCLSLAANFMDNNNPFAPSIHNYISDGNTSGKSAGEFTGMYYLMGKLWNVFGIQIWMYRLANYGLLVFACFSLFKVLNRYWNSVYWSLTVSLFVLTSPLIVFYTPNFLTDITALSFSIYGWAFFLQYLENKENKKFYWALFLFLLAALFKITAAVSLLSIGGIYLLELIGFFKSEKSFFDRKWKFFCCFLVSLLAIASWYIYAEYYNKIHGGKYTFNSLWPLWGLDDTQYHNAIKFFLDITIHQFFHKLILVVLVVLSLTAFIITFTKSKRIFTLLFLIFLGYTLYIIFWFGALENHDYYFINLFTLPLIILAINIHYLLKFLQNKKLILVSAGVSFFLFVLGTVYTASSIRLRYAEKLTVGKSLSTFFFDRNQLLFWNWTASTQRNKGIFTIEKYNRKIGIKKSDLVICYPDNSFNYSLFYINQKGWTTYKNNNYLKEPIDVMIKDGAKYLIINKQEVINSSTNGLKELTSFFTDSIGYHEGYTIYKLR